MKIPACSLYIHIPFCKAKCAYCDFFSVPADDVPERYVDAIITEIQYHTAEHNIGNLNTVYIGGGTPSLLAPVQLKRIMKYVLPLCCNTSGVAPEITIEVNPESLTPAFIEAAVCCGINRISIGVQSLNDEALLCVRRRCSREKVLDSLSLLNKSGVRFSADMIAGLPGQGDAVFLSGLEELLKYNPEHVSLYALTVEESTPLYRQIRSGSVFHNEDATGCQWVSGRALLEKAGFKQYEVSNFAKPECWSRHNMSYWKQFSYVGVGAGATGTLYNSKSETIRYSQLMSALRYTNNTSISLYTDFWTGTDRTGYKFSELKNLPLDLELLNPEILSFEFFMLGLRLREGISSAEYVFRFGKNLNTAVFEKWHGKGLAIIQPEGSESMRYALSAEGILFLNTFLENILE